MLDVLVAMTKLMAPVLSFTADEIWRMLPEPARGGGHMFSVHSVSHFRRLILNGLLIQNLHSDGMISCM